MIRRERQPQTAQQHAERQTGRVEAFSDAVFGVAITLLVFNLLSLHVLGPGVANNSSTPIKLAQALGGNWPTYLTYVISFATVLIMWVYHHRLFQGAAQAETALLFANGLLLLLVTGVPFPTAVVAAYLLTPAASVACALYGGYFAVVDLAYDLLWWVVARQHAALQPRESGRLPLSMLISLLGFPCYVIAALAAFLSPYITLGICSALWIVWSITAPTTGMKHPVSLRLPLPRR